MPNFWTYESIEKSQEKPFQTNHPKRSKAYRSGTVRESTFADKTYYHCPECGRGWYNVQEVLSCCSGEKAHRRREKKH